MKTSGVYRVAFRTKAIGTLRRNTNWTSSAAAWLGPGVTGIQLVAEYEKDPFGIHVPGSTRIVVELSAESPDDAVLKATPIADTLGRIIAFQAGAPHEVPRTIALFNVTPGLKRRTFMQWNYNTLGVNPSRPLHVFAIETVLDTLSKLPVREREAIVRAIKWYTDALREADATDRFIKIWVGLESVGAIINRRVHKSGWRSCKDCAGTLADREGDQKEERGIRHMLSIVDTSRTDTFDRLKKARNKLIHSEWPLERVRAIIDPLLPLAVEASTRSILTALAGPTEKRGAREALLPTKELPNVADVLLTAELLTPDPNALGELADKFDVTSHLRSSEESTDGYTARAAFDIHVELPCRYENLQLTSLRKSPDSIQIDVDREPEFEEIQAIRRKR